MPGKPASNVGILFCPFCLTRRPFLRALSASPLWPAETYAGKARLKRGHPFLPVLSHTPSVSAGAVRIPALAGGNLCRESPPQTRASFFARFVSHAVRFRKCCPHPRFGRRKLMPEKPASKAGVLFCPFCLTRRPFPRAPSASPLWPADDFYSPYQPTARK